MENSSTVRIDLQRLQILNDRLCQTLEALNQVRMSCQSVAPSYGIAPGYNVAPSYGFAPGYNVAPNYGFTPGYNVAPSYGIAPGYNTAPSFGQPQTQQFWGAPIHPMYAGIPMHPSYNTLPSWGTLPGYTPAPQNFGSHFGGHANVGVAPVGFTNGFDRSRTAPAVW